MLASKSTFKLHWLLIGICWAVCTFLFLKNGIETLKAFLNKDVIETIAKKPPRGKVSLPNIAICPKPAFKDPKKIMYSLADYETNTNSICNHNDEIVDANMGSRSRYSNDNQETGGFCGKNMLYTSTFNNGTPWKSSTLFTLAYGKCLLLEKEKVRNSIIN